MVTSTLLKCVKSLRLQRGRGWRAVRLGVVGVVVVVVVCMYLLPTQNNHDEDDWLGGSPNLQVAPPMRDNLRTEEENGSQLMKKNEIDFMVDDAGRKFNARGRKEEKDKQKKDANLKHNENQENDENEKIIPKIFPQRRIILPGDGGLVVEEEEDEEEEEEEEGEDEEGKEGKWKGRNMEEKDNNHAMEELDEGLKMDDKEGNSNNNNNKNIDDDFVEEDVGGEEMKKKKRERRENPKKKETQDMMKNNAKEKKESIYIFNVDKHNLDPKQGKEGQGGKNDLDDLVGVEEEMRRRRSKVKEVCLKYGLGTKNKQAKVKHPPTPTYETFYIDRKDKLAWCPVYKAASTSWLYAFLSLSGISESYISNTREQVSTVARRVWPALPYEEAKQAVGECVKAVVVRHPFERLASAYRDKLEKVAGGERHGTEHFYQKYGRKIVEKYRKRQLGKQINNNNNNNNNDKPPARYKHILDDSPPQPQRYRHTIDTPQGKEPTFKEFVQYLIDTDLALYADDHWMPYYLSCTPCLVDFEVIAKFETLDRDQAYLLYKTGLKDKLTFSWQHLTKGSRTRDVVRKYFAEISRKDMMSLYEKYRLDFEMFDYSVDDYLNFLSPTE